MRFLEKMIKKIEGLLAESELNFFWGFCLSMTFYIFLCIMLIIQNSSKDSLQLVLMSIPSFLLVVVTLAYVLLTQKLVKTNQALFDAQSSPCVIAYSSLIPDGNTGFIYLNIENVGPGVARNIVFKIIPSDLRILDGDFNSHSLIKTGISILGPQQRQRMKLCGADLDGNCERFFFPENIPKFQIIINYENSLGKKIGPEIFIIDKEMYKNQ
ncbi:hypothetical protein [Methanoregula sp.]|uniref:hypothetical protein n=1 Tax=Methanoregula sp. TaxID=2052170 RepID=UPI003566CBE5